MSVDILLAKIKELEEALVENDVHTAEQEAYWIKKGKRLAYEDALLLSIDDIRARLRDLGGDE